MDTTTNKQASDIDVENWVDKWMPAPLRPYCRLARLDRPIGTWLLLLPCWWSLALATDGWPNPAYILLFGLGALVMRGAGCTINDLADRDFDAKVARTATRPIASGAVSPLQAMIFLGLQLGLGLAVLVQFNSYTVWLGISSLGLVVIYPFMKRITYWPQACLGLAFNWGALLGWTAEAGQLQAAPLVLYAAGFFWTLGYDTIYAHQDKADDILIGVKSTALKFGDASKPWISAFYAISLGLICLAGYLAHMTWPFYVGVGLGAVQLAWQVTTLDMNDPKNCLRRFKSNRDFGLIVFWGIVAAQVL
ncbi:MAG: 4-hydroxybenzoate octaprenyltransferase [Rhodospirillales bacterium]|nr:4-hydroxybenzoate octaprenyltransferase [Rhodospirillales bacterium]